VDEAVASLPDSFLQLMENVVIAVEDEPDPELLEDRDSEELLGIYLGVPRTERHLEGSYMPDEILIFREPLMRMCRNREELTREIRITVVHEVGHYFGLSEEEIVGALGP
jgi:predicted Zn-dependent protease with MMP-like domain